MISIKTLLNRFFKTAKNRIIFNSWLSDGTMEVYLRKGIRFYGGKKIITLEIANVNVVEQNKGYFTRFLRHVEVVHPWDAVYVESILSQRFLNFFLKHGYILEPRAAPPSVIKITNKELRKELGVKDGNDDW